MEISRSWVKKFCSLISFLGTGFAAICTIIDNFFPKCSIPELVKQIAVFSLIVGTLCGVITMCLSFGDNSKKVLPVEGTASSSFFVKWYKNPGQLTLCCSDLKWVSNTMPNILNTLNDKAEKHTLTLWLDANNLKEPNVEKLRKAGAVVNPLPNEVINDKIVFSIREHSGHKWYILRYKGEDDHTSHRMTVHILDSSAYIAVLDGYLNSIERISRRT